MAKIMPCPRWFFCCAVCSVLCQSPHYFTPRPPEGIGSGLREAGEGLVLQEDQEEVMVAKIIEVMFELTCWGLHGTSMTVPSPLPQPLLALSVVLPSFIFNRLQLCTASS